MVALALAAAVVLAFHFGVADAPNATAALLGSGAATPRRALGVSGTFHLLGGILGGSAVAGTLGGLVAVAGAHAVVVYAAACLAAVGVVAAAARLGVPTSAAFGLVGGLVGAAVAVEGAGAVSWGGFSGPRPVGVVGVVVGMLASPVAGLVAAVGLRRLIGRGARRARRRALRPVRAATWVGAAAVAFAGGANDGQKAMAVMAVALAAGGTTDPGVPMPARLGAAAALAAGTVVGGRRVIRTVARRFYRPRPLDGLAAQVVAAVLIAGAGPAGAPVSTSSVAAAAVVGSGAAIRPRHVRWNRAAGVYCWWVATIPVSAVVGAAMALGLRPLR